jgi:hypothetical protein
MPGKKVPERRSGLHPSEEISLLDLEFWRVPSLTAEYYNSVSVYMCIMSIQSVYTFFWGTLYLLL